MVKWGTEMKIVKIGKYDVHKYISNYREKRGIFSISFSPLRTA